MKKLTAYPNGATEPSTVPGANALDAYRSLVTMKTMEHEGRFAAEGFAIASLDGWRAHTARRIRWTLANGFDQSPTAIY